MSSRMVLIFSHTLTREQEEDARKSLFVDEFIFMPKNLSKIWSQIPPEGDLDLEIMSKFTNFIRDNAEKGDYVLIQGDFGATFALVDWCLREGYIPVYATTHRIYKQRVDKHGNIVNQHVFSHVGFRKYKRIKPF